MTALQADIERIKYIYKRDGTPMSYDRQCALQVLLINESVTTGRHETLAIALKTYGWLKIEYNEAVRCARKNGHSKIKALKDPKIDYEALRASFEQLYAFGS
jgi:hypothetical protein